MVDNSDEFKWSIPSAFKVSAIIVPASRSSATASAHIGTDANNKMFIGQTGSNKAMGIFVKVNGSYVVYDSLDNVLPINDWKELVYSYDNGVQTLTDGTNTVTVNNNQITARSYVYFRNVTNSIKEILFLPL